MIFLKLFVSVLLCSFLNIHLDMPEACGKKDKQPLNYLSEKTYIIHKTPEPIVVDGIADELVWNNTNWTDYFVDIQGEGLPKPRFKTRAKMLWDDEYLYIFAQLEEPHVWATIRQRDAVIFMENNFEIFIDPDGDTHHYYELEMNALGTFWDLMLTKPYRNGGRPLNAWDIKGLQIGIDIQGTLNDPSDRDEGWSVEVAIPFNVLDETTRSGHPADGTQWHLNFSRVEWQTDISDGTYVKRKDPDSGKNLPEDNWVWSPQGVINMHLPERWGIVQFSEKSPTINKISFSHSLDMDYSWILRELYYKQKNYWKQHRRYADHLEQLNADELFDEHNLHPRVEIRVLDDTFIMSLTAEDSDFTFYIRDDSKAWKQLKK